jgi:hypothetical protein
MRHDQQRHTGPVHFLGEQELMAQVPRQSIRGNDDDGRDGIGVHQRSHLAQSWAVHRGA